MEKKQTSLQKMFEVLPQPSYYLSADRTYVFDFTGKKVKYATNDDDKFSVQSKFDLAWFIDRIDPDMHVGICEDVYKYDEIKRILLEMLIEKGYSNVQIIK